MNGVIVAGAGAGCAPGNRSRTSSWFDEGILPARAGKPGEVRIGRTDLQVTLDRERGKMRIRGQIASHSRRPQKGEENPGMPLAGVEHRDLWSAQPRLDNFAGRGH
jgi:hypothetical protein